MTGATGLIRYTTAKPLLFKTTVFLCPFLFLPQESEMAFVILCLLDFNAPVLTPAQYTRLRILPLERYPLWMFFVDSRVVKKTAGCRRQVLEIEKKKRVSDKTERSKN